MEQLIKPEVHVLLVDDDEIDIEHVRRAFKKINLNIRLHIANNGVDALNQLYGKNGEKKLIPLPQLIILDINMPKMNGIEFLKTLRENPEFNAINVLVLTGSGSEIDREAASNLNVSGYFVKPLHLHNFLEICTTLLAE